MCYGNIRRFEEISRKILVGLFVVHFFFCYVLRLAVNQIIISVKIHAKSVLNTNVLIAAYSFHKMLVKH